MAKSKGIDLNKRVLAKLMLLEYFKPETFNSFHQLQTENGGVLPKIGLIEKRAIGKEDKADTEGENKISTEQEAYLQDSWLKNWFGSEPSLQNQNLQPYYYFSRDRLSLMGLSLQRMSPRAQEFYRKLISEAESISNNALKDAKGLSDGDASAIFEALGQKIKETGKGSGTNTLLQRIFSLSKQRPELMSQLMGFIEKFPDNDLPVSVVSWLHDTSENTQYKAVAKGLVQKWETSTSNKILAKISKSKLKEFE